MYSDRLTVGIVGNGFVGNAIYQNVRDEIETKVYDIDPLRSLNTFEETIRRELLAAQQTIHVLKEDNKELTKAYYMLLRENERLKKLN